MRRPRTTWAAAGLAAIALAWPSPASAQADAEDEGKRKAKGTPDELQFGARVYVRDTFAAIDLAGDTLWLEERTIDSARAFLSFRPNRRTRMDLEVDFAGDEAELKDTFIGYEPASFLDLTVGRFKRPVSFIGLESTWRLPRIDRGLLSELRIHQRRLQFAGGRGDGIAAQLEANGALRPELTLAVQQSEVADDFGLEVTELNQDLFARLEIEPAPNLHLAIAGGLVGSLDRFEDPSTYQHEPFGTIEGFFEGERVRAWLEAMGGRNANTYSGDQQLGWFAAARALVAPRWDGPGSLKEVEPYAALDWYEPSSRQGDDQLAEGTLGVALWISGKLRLQVEGTRRLAQDLAAVSDATIVRVQLGAAFESETILD